MTVDIIKSTCHSVFLFKLPFKNLAYISVHIQHTVYGKSIFKENTVLQTIKTFPQRPVIVCSSVSQLFYEKNSKNCSCCFMFMLLEFFSVGVIKKGYLEKNVKLTTKTTLKNCSSFQGLDNLSNSEFSS